MKFANIVLLSFFCWMTTSSQSEADRLIGVYYVIEPTSKEESKVEIYKNASGKYEGKVVWLQQPNNAQGKPKMDVYNPDPKKRSVRGDQIVLLHNFEYDYKTKEWKNGTIYNPIEGKTYRCYLKFESENKLKVRGYIGVPALGKTMYWKKL